MQYENYKVEDFLFDEFFVKWVKNPGPETTHFWENWIEKNPGKIRTINEAREIITSIRPKNQYKPPESAYNEVLENVLKKQSSWTQLGYFKKNDRLTSMVKYAAAVIIIVGFGALITYLNLHVYNQNQVAPKLVDKINPYGQKITFVLEDGTSIKLNAGTKIMYPETFSSMERRVRLEGEAYFEVASDETRPFIVETQNLTTLVLGTSFNIKSYEDEDEFLVAVASGKVRVTRNESPGIESRDYLLEKNQMLVYNPINNITSIIESVPDEVFAWKDNIIDFDQATFVEITKTLKRWYGVEFIINNPKALEEGHFTGEYNSETLDNVLKGLKEEDVFDFEYNFDKKNKKVFIY